MRKFTLCSFDNVVLDLLSLSLRGVCYDSVSFLHWCSSSSFFTFFVFVDFLQNRIDSSSFLLVSISISLRFFILLLSAFHALWLHSSIILCFHHCYFSCFLFIMPPRQALIAHQPDTNSPYYVHPSEGEYCSFDNINKREVL